MVQKSISPSGYLSFIIFIQLEQTFSGNNQIVILHPNDFHNGSQFKSANEVLTLNYTFNSNLGHGLRLTKNKEVLLITMKVHNLIIAEVGHFSSDQ